MPLEYYFMLAGLVLLLIEFVVPGFGVFGVSGMVCLTVGGFYVLGGNAWAALVLLAVYLFLVLVITLLCVYLPKESKYNPFVLWTRQKNSEGYTGGKNWSMLVGKRGTALTTLRPAGTILVDGEQSGRLYRKVCSRDYRAGRGQQNFCRTNEGVTLWIYYSV